MTLSDLKTYYNKISIFYNPEKAGYWNSLTRCSISEKPERLGNYYLDFSSKVNYPGSFSPLGIPLFSHKGQDSIEQPIVIGQYGLGLFSCLSENKQSDKSLIDRYLLIADWFYLNKVDFKEGTSWLIKHVYPQYNLLKPWVSAMAQGEAISVLTRASLISGNSKYEKLALEALTPFEYSVQEGGVRSYFKSLLVYEEFPTPIKPMAVLNGYIFALFGLYDLYLLNGNKKSLDLFKEGVDSLINLLPYYDIKYWTQYFLFNYPKKYFSSFTYHILVTEQLKALYIITGEKVFLQYSQIWNNYAKSFAKKTIALMNKLIFSNKVFP